MPKIFSLQMLQKDVLFVRGTTHMTRRSAAFAAEEVCLYLIFFIKAPTIRNMQSRIN